MAVIRRTVLIAVDGSDQALEAVRYISMIVPPDLTEIVLLSVGTGFPEVYWDMNRNPLYRSKKVKVEKWLADNQLVLGEFKEKAFKILSDAGFPEEAVTVKTQTKKTNILKDIVQESYQNYQALVVGRSGISRLKDLVVGSMSFKLIENVRHIPVIVVGGKPASKKILVALDESIEAMRATTCIGDLAHARGLGVSLCHVFNAQNLSPISNNGTTGSLDEEAVLKYNQNRFRPTMDEAVKRLVKAGMIQKNISVDFLFHQGNPIQKIIDTAVKGNYGTIVVGRREAVSFMGVMLHGRVSNKLISSTYDVAVWVAS
ncbi:MAG: universal stress protein [Deltaproteobacteria bacterium]|nr:universal stress protein [Deltaproteobacteria bacterium]